MEKVSLRAENASKNQRVLPVDLQGKKSDIASKQAGGKVASDSVNSQNIGRTSAEANSREGTGQNAFQSTREAAVTERGAGSFSENAADRKQSERISQSLNAGSKDKTNQSTDDVRLDAESIVRGTKPVAETVVQARANANRTLPGYLIHQVSRQIFRLRNAGENEMTLQLKPPHLGRMKLTIEHTAGGMKVGIIVESAAARDMLLANTGDLKTALADQGLRLDKIDVEAQTDFGQSMTQAGRGFGQSGNQKGRWAARNQNGLAPVSATEPGVETAARPVDSGRLDLVA
jgi:flagellar hook-length control protein FliK